MSSGESQTGPRRVRRAYKIQRELCCTVGCRDDTILGMGDSSTTLVLIKVLDKVGFTIHCLACLR